MTGLQPPFDSPVPFTALGFVATAAALLATGLHIRAAYHGPRWQVYVCKPLSTTILLLFAALSPTPHGPRYQLAVTAGLAFSLVGDVLLMLPRDRFVAGLTSFLLAHVAYIAAFTAGVPVGSRPGLLLPLLAAAVPVLRLLWPNLGTLRLPVLLYAAAILLMVWSAWARASQALTVSTALAALGATLFMVSDALLGLNRFHRPVGRAEALIMLSYVVAQALIASSVGTV